MVDLLHRARAHSGMARWLVAALYVAAGPLAAQPPDAGLAASAAPDALSFIQAIARTSRNQLVTISNNGTAPVVLGAIALNGPHAGDFAREISSNCVSGMTLPAGWSCTLAINFTPAAAGPRSAALTVPYSSGGSATVMLAGTGAASPEGSDAPAKP
jgi:hypothetical protein